MMRTPPSQQKPLGPFWPLVTAEQLRSLDHQTMTNLGLGGPLLMENAGRAMVAALLPLLPSLGVSLATGRVLVVAGPGNNGGDGFVIARTLWSLGIHVSIALCADPARVPGNARTLYQAAVQFGVPIHDCTDAAGMAQLAQQLASLTAHDLLVDALLGVGLDCPVREPLASVIRHMNQSAAWRIAVDVPSGLHADRGLPPPLSDPHAPSLPIVRAAHTLTVGALKRALLTSPGCVFAGHVTLVDIGIPQSLVFGCGATSHLLDARCMAPLGQANDPLVHKGTHGHLLIIAGSPGKTGASQLCVQAALQTGVGLCTLASPHPLPDPALLAQVPEAMSAPYDLLQPGTQIASSARGKQALVVGPGVPVTVEFARALIGILADTPQPLVLDADALNQLVDQLDRVRAATAAGRAVVLTPHPGEAARLLHCSIPEVQADRMAAADSLCRATGAVVVLKGARTLVAMPDDDRPPQIAVCPTGCAAMGTGGMGDVLAGMIGALLARGLPAKTAALAATYWHGHAADRLAARLPPGELVTARQILAELSAARRDLLTQATSPPALPWPVLYSSLHVPGTPPSHPIGYKQQ